MNERELLYLDFVKAKCRFEEFSIAFTSSLNVVQQSALEAYDSKASDLNIMRHKLGEFTSDEFKHLDDIIYCYQEIEDYETLWKRADVLSEYLRNL